jgi:hypothetical protein
MALGISPSLSSALVMTLSIAAHQPAESLSLLLAMLKTKWADKGISSGTKGRTIVIGVCCVRRSC